MDRILVFSELCDYLRISAATLYRLEAAGEGPPVVRLKGGKRYSQTAVDQWFLARSMATAREPAPTEERPAQPRRGRPRRELNSVSDALRSARVRA
ncbi:MAG TPA: helix-turn-helix domain-containing protein [Methylibium sp.]|uniref:helix-turn-helix transcriptional regulator n=1 Tax=Methylibium sp. TaxID=2067992 RepID=UPI002DBC9B87|nr:helix-turn-helix domain-containing protein [Methylibium sp.]HEU4458826.1 helix-turn-helix domain-containing protein [Methylibium sp.]